MQNKLMHYKKKMVRQVHGKKIRRTLYPPTKNFPPQIETIRRDGRKKIDGRLPADKIFIAADTEHFAATVAKKLTDALSADKKFPAAD